MGVNMYSRYEKVIKPMRHTIGKYLRITFDTSKYFVTNHLCTSSHSCTDALAIMLNVHHPCYTHSCLLVCFEVLGTTKIEPTVHFVSRLRHLRGAPRFSIGSSPDSSDSRIAAARV